jgi:uncharacterized hydrophobic protein (TIGR00271 family)
VHQKRKESVELGIIRTIIKDNQITPDDVPRIEEALFYEGPKGLLNIESFAVLMFFATIIATYGVIGDSTATVIGAMIVAPLMTPIMATAAALVMGRMDRAGRALLLVACGVVGAIVLSWLIGFVYSTGVISVSTNSQIVSRTSPKLVDLYGALASGAVGAFAMSRKDVANTLPGVAIAIALVPPLTVVGLTLSQGAYSDSWGAFLLFLTNFFSILLAGGGIFAILGLSAASTKGLNASARRRAFQFVGLGTLLVIIPLAATSFATGRAGIVQSQTRQAARQWLAGTDYEIIEVVASGDNVKLAIAGSDEVPDTALLAESMLDKGRGTLVIDLNVVPAVSDLVVVRE